MTPIEEQKIDETPAAPTSPPQGGATPAAAPIEEGSPPRGSAPPAASPTGESSPSQGSAVEKELIRSLLELENRVKKDVTELLVPAGKNILVGLATTHKYLDKIADEIEKQNGKTQELIAKLDVHGARLDKIGREQDTLRKMIDGMEQLLAGGGSVNGSAGGHQGAGPAFVPTTLGQPYNAFPVPAQRHAFNPNPNAIGRGGYQPQHVRSPYSMPNRRDTPPRSSDYEAFSRKSKLPLPNSQLAQRHPASQAPVPQQVATSSTVPGWTTRASGAYTSDDESTVAAEENTELAQTLGEPAEIAIEVSSLTVETTITTKTTSVEITTAEPVSAPKHIIPKAAEPVSASKLTKAGEAAKPASASNLTTTPSNASGEVPVARVASGGFGNFRRGKPATSPSATPPCVTPPANKEKPSLTPLLTPTSIPSPKFTPMAKTSVLRGRGRGGNAGRTPVAAGHKGSQSSGPSGSPPIVHRPLNPDEMSVISMVKKRPVP